jgi:hypothetical protein
MRKKYGYYVSKIDTKIDTMPKFEYPKLPLYHVYISQEFGDLRDYLQDISFVRIKDIMDEDVDFCYGIDRGCDIMPKLGFVTNDKNNLCGLEPITTYEYNDKTWYFVSMENALSLRTWKDITLLIQGTDTDTTWITACIMFLYGPIYISTWRLYNFEEVKNKVEKEGLHNDQNIYYQVYTTCKGLDNINTERVIKVRSDECYADFSIFLDTMEKNKDKIVTNNIFIRRKNAFAFHCSDHIIGGLTQNIKGMFERARDMIHGGLSYEIPFDKYIWVPEQVLTVGYLSGMYPIKSLTMDRCPYLMKDHFVSVGVETFRNFQIMYTKYKWRFTPEKVRVSKINWYYHKAILIDLDSYDRIF